MPIPLLVGFAAIAVPIILIIVTLILNARYQKKQAKEWFGKKSANQLATLFIVVNIIVIILSTYLLFIFDIE